MSEPLDLKSDEFMNLLTDALRNGPVSPQWHQVVAALRPGAGRRGICDAVRREAEPGTR